MGKRFKAVIDEAGEGIAVGRLYSHAPEIDGVVIMESAEEQKKAIRQAQGDTVMASLSNHDELPSFRASELKIGDFVTVEITDVYDYDLKGIIVR
ncbi:MAG: TRAM domain-containing protein [Thermodesulfovibrionales bacterium]|nr:TRAM domain-containing protein [Thermodesulfovibrionales bacterium]